MMAILVGLALRMVPLASFCTTDAAGYCTDQLVHYAVRYEVPDAVVRINVALGTAVTVELPPLVDLRSDLTVGNGAILHTKLAGNAKSADSPLRLSLWPQMPERAGQMRSSDMLGRTTNLHLPLDGGITVTVELKVAPPEQSVQRLVLDFPQRQQESTYVQERLSEERQKLMSEVAQARQAAESDRAEQLRQSLAETMLQPVFCDSLRERRERGLLIVRATRLCRLGDHLYMNFSIQNRARDLFTLGGVEVREAGTQDEAPPLEATIKFGGLEPVMLGYDGEIRGVAAWRAEGGARAHSLRIVEDGGKKRDVILHDVGF